MRNEGIGNAEFGVRSSVPNESGCVHASEGSSDGIQQVNWDIGGGSGGVMRGVVDGAWFMPLPQLPGSTQAGDAFAVSADGSTVVGTSHDGLAFQAVRWTSGGRH